MTRQTPDALLRALPRHDDSGATSAEYGLIASLIAAVIGLTVATLGTEVLALFQAAADAFTP